MSMFASQSMLEVGRISKATRKECRAARRTVQVGDYLEQTVTVEGQAPRWKHFSCVANKIDATAAADLAKDLPLRFRVVGSRDNARYVIVGENAGARL